MSEWSSWEGSVSGRTWTVVSDAAARLNKISEVRNKM